MDTTKEQLISVLKKHNKSVTKARLYVFGALLKKHPLSIKELIKLLEGAADRASVYRTLQLFERIGIVEKLHVGWKYKYELSGEFMDHHHHAACISCGSVFKLTEDVALEHSIQTLGQAYLARVDFHSLEIRGLCSACVSQDHI